MLKRLAITKMWTAYVSVNPLDGQVFRTELGVSTDELLLAYIGGFSANRMLLPFIQTAALLPDISFHLWGGGPQQAAVEAAVQEHENVIYHGWVSADSLPVIFNAVDIIFYCLRLDYPGAIYNAPNTLSQAMAASRPIIANRVGDLGRIVWQAECGVLIDEATPTAIAEAIMQLQDPNKRSTMGAKGLQAAQTTYNTAIVQQRLIELYARLG